MQQKKDEDSTDSLYQWTQTALSRNDCFVPVTQLDIVWYVISSILKNANVNTRQLVISVCFLSLPSVEMFEIQSKISKHLIAMIVVLSYD